MNAAVPVAALLLAAASATQAPPAVRALSPADGARDVDPATTSLTIAFSTDMDRRAGWSICGGGPSFPKIGKIAWRDARTLELQVGLEPGVRYELPLNCAGSGQNFRDTAGIRLAPTPWSFTTRDDRIADPARQEANAAAFDRLRALVEHEYSYRDRAVADWGARFDAQRDAVVRAATAATFARRCADLLAAAEDPHLWLDVGGQRIPTDPRPARSPNVDLAALARELPGLERPNPAVWHATFDAPGLGEVGYLAVHTLASERQRELGLVQDLLGEMAGRCAAVVLDLRANGGGNEALALPIAAWFVEGRRVYAGHWTRNPETGAFDRYEQRTVAGHGPERSFRGPVAVLIGPQCMSSCEAFVLMMRQAERAVLVGARTRGSSGNPQPHELGNGVTVWLPSWRATDAEGRPFEGLGIAPDLEVEAGGDASRTGDPVLRAALARLGAR